MEEVSNGFPILWGHLRECEECANAVLELMHLARERGYQERHSDDSEMPQPVVMFGLAGILAVFIAVVGFFLWQPRTPEGSVSRVYQQVAPAVANIQVQPAGTTGSGIVFDRNGYILTNYHVIDAARNDQEIIVQLPGPGQVPLELVGYDTATDLAVLKVDVPPDHLTVANFGDSTRVQAGDLAMAIGNPFGLSQSLTVGHISAVGRRLISDDSYAPEIEGVLQTDAAINPGNSGGPLLNASGQVIGINTRMESPSGGSVGLGFAIPSNTAIQVAQEIIMQSYVRRPWPDRRGGAAYTIVEQRVFQGGSGTGYPLLTIVGNQICMKSAGFFVYGNEIFRNHEW
ncbi:MAG: S1C family serine protease [Anaerolineae bacterium]